MIKVILVSAWFAGFVALLAWTIWGRIAEWSYRTGMSPTFRWLYQGRLREKEVWVLYQKRMAWFGLFFVTLVYVLIIISVTRQ